MYLQSLTFRENAGQNIEWLIDNVSLGEINLVVGKNSSGKTRTLNALSDLVSMLRGRGTSASGPVSYELLFRNSADLMRYDLEYDLDTIRSERLYVGEELVLERGEEGNGVIKYEATPGAIFLEFEIPHDQLACYAKRDRLQHPFIEIIHGWAISLRRFDFSGDLGKSRYVLKSSFEAKELDLSITNNSLVPLITVAVEEYPQFRDLILKDMQQIGYDLEDFGVIHFSERFGQTNQDRFAVYTTEKGLEKQVTQRDMSQGMFRAFSVLIQVNYYILCGQKGFVIIDDIGEGLDFNRAKQLVQVLIAKAKESGIQLIMSTNDSFIMNAVDIENWAVIMREGHKISLYNYENSKEIFEEFKFTGLNNFDFYASEFFRSGFSDEEENGPGTEEDQGGMRKLAIFVEGLTEQILVRKMLHAVLDRNRIAIQTVKITGGHNVRMSFTVMRAAHVDSRTDYFVLVYDCGGETNVKSYMLARRDKLISNGYSMVLGLRDCYPNFNREEVPKLLRGLNLKLPQKKAATHIYLAVMETEAWFLGEYRHLKKVSRILTPGYINKHFGFNPQTENMEEREHPSDDMKRIYQAAGHDYTKKRDRLNAVIAKLDFSYFTHELAEMMPSLGAFVEGLEKFFQEEL